MRAKNERVNEKELTLFMNDPQDRQQADFIMADSGSSNNFSTTENVPTEENCLDSSVDRKRKNSTDSARLKSVKSASISVIKKGIKMGATGFQQASTQIKKKTASPGLSQIHSLKYTSQTKIFKFQSKIVD